MKLKLCKTAAAEVTLQCVPAAAMSMVTLIRPSSAADAAIALLRPPAAAAVIALVRAPVAADAAVALLRAPAATETETKTTHANLKLKVNLKLKTSLAICPDALLPPLKLKLRLLTPKTKSEIKTKNLTRHLARRHLVHRLVFCHLVRRPLAGSAAEALAETVVARGEHTSSRWPHHPETSGLEVVQLKQ